MTASSIDTIKNNEIINNNSGRADMPTPLRPFQADLERRIYEAWNSGATNVMPVSATGSGKTVVLSKIMYDEPGASVAIAHRQELVSQISVALARNGVRHRVLGAKKGSNLIRVISALQVAELGYSYFDPNAKAGVGGVDTVIRMDPNDPFFKQARLVVQDEAHHVLKGNKWGKAAEMFPNARSLLPTATPLRADGKGLGRHADGLVDAMVLAPTMREVINMGYLTDYRIFSPPSDLDLSQVATSQATGDFNADQLRKAVHKSHITGDVVAHYLRLTPGKLGVTFAVDVAAAGEIAAAFRSQGVPAEVVSAKTPDALRAAVLRRFRAGEIKQVVNVDLFGEGFDLPAVEVVSFARPTESFALYSQQFGRALRLMIPPELASQWDRYDDAGRREAIRGSVKPTAYIIDHVNNVMRHGLPDANREWSLDRRERSRGKKSDAIPLRICVNTECLQPYERIFKCCPHCGEYPPPPSRSDPIFVDGDLTELDAETLAMLRGDIARIDGDAIIPYGAAPDVAGAVRRRHFERREAQADLRNSIAWWAGLEAAQGRGESESYRRFFYKFGVDVANAQTLGAREAGELSCRVRGELLKYGIDGTVNASVYFANNQ
jgi:superfamily II DNA or RNA helicase